MQEICSFRLRCLLLWLTLSSPRQHKSYTAVWLDLDWWAVQLKKKKESFSERILTKLDILDILFVKALWMNSNPKTHQRSESRLGIRASRVIRQLDVGQQFSQLWVIWGFWDDSPSCLLEPTLRAGEMNTTNRAWSTGSIHQADIETEHLAGCLSTKSWCNLWVLQLYYVRRSTGGKTLLL